MVVKTQVLGGISHFQACLEIAVSFFNEGNYREAREVLTSALEAGEAFSEREIFTLRMNLAMVEQWDKNIAGALSIYEEIVSQAGLVCDNQLAGKFYGNYAYALRCAGERDRGILALTEASYHFEQAGDTEKHFSAENNLGVHLAAVGKFEDAHLHFDKAKRAVKDTHHLAQVYEAQAAAYCTEGEAKKDLALLLKAHRLIDESLRLLDSTDRRALLGESIRTAKRIASALEKLFNIQEEKPHIEAALKAANGEPTAAARILGMTPTSLSWKLEHQHPDLLPLRAEKKRPRGMHVVKSRPPK